MSNNVINNNNAQNYAFPADEISLKEIFRPVWSRRWKIVFFSLFITLFVAVYVSLLRPSYKTTAVLQIGSNKPQKTLSLKDAFNEGAASQEQIQTQYELLKSRKFAVRVIEKLDLINHPDFNGVKYNENVKQLPFIKAKPKTKPTLDQVISLFQRRLAILPRASTELVDISFTTYSPELAMRVANQIGETYLQYQDEIHSASKETTSQWLVDQLQELGRKLRNSEIALQAFREQEKIVDISGVLGLVSKELNELTSGVLHAEKARDDLAVVVDNIKRNKTDIDAMLKISEVSKHPAIIQLRSTENTINRRVSEISKRYGPKHPKRIAVEAELTSIKQRITEQVKEIVEAIEKDYASTLEKQVAQNQRLEAAKADFLRLSRLENKFSQLLREVETNKELYQTYLIRLKEADAMGNYKANFYVRFIDKAIEPKYPIAPRKVLIVIIAFMLCVLIMSATVVLKELLVDNLNSNRKLEKFHEAPILAVLPKFKTKSRTGQPAAYKGAYTDNRFVESLRSLRTALLFKQNQLPPKVIAITSSVPDEGKSTVAMHLARSFSEMEKVLLIEADLRHPTVAKNLGLDPYRPGLSNLLAKTHQINECIVRNEELKLDVLTSGISPSNPLAFLSMKRFKMLIKVFGNFYDRIIIETPPVNAVSDAVIISKVVDSVIYIVHSSKTKREHVISGLKVLKQVNAPIEGVVINQSQDIDTSKYQNKYYNDMANIIKLPIRKQV